MARSEGRGLLIYTKVSKALTLVDSACEIQKQYTHLLVAHRNCVSDLIVWAQCTMSHLQRMDLSLSDLGESPRQRYEVLGLVSLRLREDNDYNLCSLPHSD